MTQGRATRIPSYQKILQDIVSQIECGILGAGDTVESERKLAKRHSVSLMTARHALSELAAKGWVLRKPRSGTVVAPPKIQSNCLASYSEQMRERSTHLRSKVVRIATVRNHEIAAQLWLASDDSLTQIERVRMGTSAPLALESSYLSGDTSCTWTAAALKRESIFFLLQQKCKVRLSHSDEEIDAVSADARAADLLRISVGTPLIRIRKRVYSTETIPCLYILGLYRADTHRITLRLPMSSSGEWD